jgi:tetratricopeptide (TPR) repeat protein
MICYLRTTVWVGRIGLLLAVTFLILSCGSSPPKQKVPPQDQELERFIRAARQAYDKGRLEQAANFYRRALEQAYLRDDTAAILDAQYNLAVCLLNLNSDQEALDVVRRAKTEMVLADYGKSLDYLLLEATILHRRGDLDRAWQISDQILSGPEQPSPDINRKTHFLRGLIASERGDIAQLRAEITAFGQPQQMQLRADQLELLGRLAMAEQNWVAAIDACNAAVNLRREALDYRGMARALVLTGEASEKAGHHREAAIHYLRAGRSAFFKEQLVDAQQWLNHSVRLASTTGDDKIVQEARDHLRQIEALNANSLNGSDEK